MTAAQLCADLSAALARLEADESDETAAEVARLVAEAQDKGSALVHVLRRAALEEQHHRAAAARYEARARAAVTLGAWAKGQVLELAQLAGGRLRGPDYAATVRPGRGSVQVVDLAAVPADLVRTVREPLTAAIGERLRAGEDVPGCVLDVKPSLVISGGKGAA